MSSEHSNLWDCNKRHSENSLKCTGNSTLINSKIRKCFFTLNDKQIERDLRFTISICSDDGICDQNMVVELTNDVNPIFLFQLSITKTDFDTLKNDQGLNVEFHDFPQALVNLLDQCKESVSENGEKFKLILVDYCGTAAGGRLMDMNKITIKIIEECAFRNICHLTLDILRATELQIRQKLEEELCKFKQSLLIKSKHHDEALIKISDLVEQIDMKNKIIEKSNGIINDLMIQKEEECSRLRNQAETQEALIREKFNEKISEEQKQFEKQSSQMQAKLENLDKQLRLFHDKELEMQNILHEKERNKELLEIELISKKQEISQLRTQNEKLDSDYHDKERTVNILRTRLAVTEQELKDNNILILNHQNKLDEMICEKNNFQTKIEFLQSKIDKKDVTIKNLSDEIIKANDIIAKQHGKISTISSKLSEYESVCYKLEQSLKAKDDEMCKQNEVLSKLQDCVKLSDKESNELKEVIGSLETKITELIADAKEKSKLFTSLKDYFGDHSTEPKLNTQQRSMLSYRTFLSLPNLLPSDNHRLTEDLLEFVLQDHITSTHTSPSDSSKFSGIIKPYIARYLKRFQSVPMSLFRSSNVPLKFLYSPHKSRSPLRKKLSKDSIENVSKVTEYSVYNRLGDYLPVPQSKSYKHIEFNEPNCNSNKIRHLGKTESSSNIKIKNDARQCIEAKKDGHQCIVPNSNRCDGDNNVGFKEKSVNPVPHYALVSAFRLKPDRSHRVFPHPSVYKSEQQSINMGQDKIGSNAITIRKTPAVSAPPLTPEQRNDVDFVFKTYKAQNMFDTVPTVNNQHAYLQSSEFHKPVDKNKLLPSTSRNNPAGTYKSVSEILTPISAADTESDFLRSDNHNNLSDKSESVTFHRDKYDSSLKPFVTLFDKSQTFSGADRIEVSVDFPEPSAYFGS